VSDERWWLEGDPVGEAGLGGALWWLSPGLLLRYYTIKHKISLLDK